jgi:hypothetical protein
MYDRTKPAHLAYRITNRRRRPFVPATVSRQGSRAAIRSRWPAPTTASISPRFLARPVVAGLVLGVVGGSPLGLGFALLLKGAIVIPGWEQLYSVAPSAFTKFWLGIGLAIGGLVGGMGAMLLTPAERRAVPIGATLQPQDATDPPVENGA